MIDASVLGILQRNRTVWGLSFCWEAHTAALQHFYHKDAFFGRKKNLVILWHRPHTLRFLSTPFKCYIRMAATVFPVPPSSARAYLLLIICCAIKWERGLWPEDFCMAVRGLTAFGNLRCCTNNGNIISGISCHLINVRRLSIPAMIYGCENTE